MYFITTGWASTCGVIRYRGVIQFCVQFIIIINFMIRISLAGNAFAQVTYKGAIFILTIYAYWLIIVHEAGELESAIILMLRNVNKRQNDGLHLF